MGRRRIRRKDRRVVQDVANEVAQIRSGPRRVPDAKLEENAAQRPQVRPVRVDAFVQEQLWRHVVRGASLPGGGVAAVVAALTAGVVSSVAPTEAIVSWRLRHPSAEAKVAQLHDAVLVHEHVARLQVAKQDAVRVQVLQTRHEVHAKHLEISPRASIELYVNKR